METHHMGSISSLPPPKAYKEPAFHPPEVGLFFPCSSQWLIQLTDSFKSVRSTNAAVPEPSDTFKSIDRP
jgi:hypothetical protein